MGRIDLRALVWLAYIVAGAVALAMLLGLPLAAWWAHNHMHIV